MLACRAVALCEGWVLLLIAELSIGTLVGWVTANGEGRMSNDEFWDLTTDHADNTDVVEAVVPTDTSTYRAC